MYSVFKIALNYAKYYLTARNGKGHGIHSPFVFDLVKHVFNDKIKYSCYASIEQVRREMLVDRREISVIDFGAGSGMLKTGKRLVKNIAATSLKPRKYAQLLFRLIQYFKPGTMLELGTSLGITSAYLASGNPGSEFITCEGDPAISIIAKNNFKKLIIKNIEVCTGDFKTTLPGILQQTRSIDFAFIDGDHKKQSTLDYFNLLLGNVNEDSVFVFDDIHWSKEMEDAWELIKKDERVTLTIDLFFIGMVFFKRGIHHKQHFVIRF